MTGTVAPRDVVPDARGPAEVAALSSLTPSCLSSSLLLCSLMIVLYMPPTTGFFRFPSAATASYGYLDMV